MPNRTFPNSGGPRPALWAVGLFIAVLTFPTETQAQEFSPQPLHDQIERLNDQLVTQPEKVELYSQRGDAWFFLGDSTRALADYNKMVELAPRQQATHWRRGIALFYAGEYAEGAKQFDRYHATDQVDRENGIWRFLCQYKTIGKEKARAQLLNYTQDDREPLVALYALFAGKTEPAAILKEIETKPLAKTEREKQRFYAELYIGLFLLVEEQPDAAKGHLQQAVINSWPQTAGYGPNYMWHVARLQADLLNKKPAAGQ